MARPKQKQESRLTVEWLDAVASWAQRQPVPSVVTNADLYYNGLVALQFQRPGRPLFLGVVNTDGYCDYRRGDVLIFEPTERGPQHCIVETPFAIENIRENFTARQLFTTYRTFIGFPLHLLDTLPDPKYPAW